MHFAYLLLGRQLLLAMMFFIYFFLMFVINISFAKETVMIPVLSHSLTSGKKIEQKDLIEKEISIDKIGHQVIVNPLDIIGKIIHTQFIKSGVPIKKTDLKEKSVIKKGDMVRVVFKNAHLTISNQGIAQKDGAEGEAIAVEIMNSKRKIYGKVTGHQEVRVGNY
jgi:flagella basal body P-ring formation protein FlgA